MNIKKFIRVIYLPSEQIRFLILLSSFFSLFSIIGKAVSLIIYNAMLTLYGIELTSRTLNIRSLLVGHSTGVVLGGNGIHCSGRLHVSSGVVFGRRYDYAQSTSDETREAQEGYFFEIDGDPTVGSNSVLLGPSKIRGPVIIGAMSLVTKDINPQGVYVGSPAVCIKEF